MKYLSRQGSGLLSTFQVCCSAFTLVEMLVSLVILTLMLGLVFSIMGSMTKIWTETSGAIGEWQSARNGFDLMTRRISQATLNTTWAYFDGPNGTGNLTTSNPVSYGRYSALQFVCGSATGLLPGVTNTTSDSIFFQAPLGYTRNTGLRGLNRLLNATGFFVQYNNDASFRPNLGIFGAAEQKQRFRLMELSQPSEDLQIYNTNSATNYQWFTSPIVSGSMAYPLAENVVLLCILPKYSSFDTATGSVLAPQYYYNSQQSYAFNSGGIQGNTLCQLPPLLQVTMVAIDENSARRLNNQSPGQMPSSIFTNAPFTQAASYSQDMAQFEQNLISQRLNYRIFSSVIAIRGAKWSGN